MNKRCTNCGKFPFCKDIKEPGKPTDCEKWVKRNYMEVQKNEVYRKRMGSL